mgnify:CR=1 FL=1
MKKTINWNMVGLVVSVILVLGMIGMGSPRGLAGMLLFIGCYLFLFVFDFIIIVVLGAADQFFPAIMTLGFNIYIIAMSFSFLTIC